MKTKFCLRSMKKYLLLLILLSACAPKDYEQIKAIAIQTAQQHNALVSKLYAEKVLARPTPEPKK